MSYPYPQDRHRDRKEKGDQPYQDAQESMAQQGATQQSEATQNAPDVDPTSTGEVSEEMIERLRQVNDEIGRRGHDEPE